MTDNELIAEFMGLPRSNSDQPLFFSYIGGGPSKGKTRHADRIGYQSSWNALMPVVGKMANGPWVTSLEASGAMAHLTHGLKTGLINADIELVHHEVIEFIKWYNENKKP